ncbi:hypothetical protein U0070_012948 [Myodes glareolus]|uniref:Uncharacterized protein n=1 Tax=Myodes glareolus TaxID=447135 RepID=A0AAW0JGF7_MYOGA
MVIAQFTPSCLPLPVRLDMSASVQWGDLLGYKDYRRLLVATSIRSYGTSTAQILLRQLLMGGRGASTPLTLVPSLLQTKRRMAHPSSQHPALSLRSSNRIDLFQCIFPVPPKGEPWSKEISPFTAQVKIEGKKEKKEENESDSQEGEGTGEHEAGGPKGEKGDSGLPGFPGSVGPKGQKGEPSELGLWVDWTRGMEKSLKYLHDKQKQ